MDPTSAELEVARAVGMARCVDPVGAGTHREVGGPPPRDGVRVGAPGGIVSYDPADLTVCVGAGTTVADLACALGAEGQECALDPRDLGATVGGTLAAGLSGPRRLRVGPLRDQVLEVRFATAEGRLVRGGGPTVKNVTGYDLPRLLVGSFGTLGVLTRVILRCRPRPPRSWWGASTDLPARIATRCFGPSAVLWDGVTTRVLVEGNTDDVDAVAAAAGLAECEPVALPAGEHRGRAALAAPAVAAFARDVGTMGDIRWIAEIGVGTVHVATDTEAGLGRARDAAHRAGGWLLREAGAPGLDGFGIELPNGGLMARVRAAFDPEAKLAPGRLPFPPPPAEGETA